MAGTTIAEDLGMRIKDLVKYTNGESAYVSVQANSNIRMSHGYPQIGDTEFVSYDSLDVDLKFPEGKNRGVVFDPDDSARRFRYTFVDLGVLHGTYASLGNEKIKAKIKAMSTYSILDELKHLVVPRPEIYNSHNVRVL